MKELENEEMKNCWKNSDKLNYGKNFLINYIYKQIKLIAKKDVQMNNLKIIYDILLFIYNFIKVTIFKEIV